MISQVRKEVELYLPYVTSGYSDYVYFIILCFDFELNTIQLMVFESC